ncbi:unnamed protein product [Kuraishia capsulata CBS 1993]|uniref:N-acetyltransferase domain-containing protein n=1 Tax=Kuraishia capsulata CBS 1993 TaxID=1382522 RepID=W6MLA4_9ASCO|nr:uncharacterized protein KUCA_T00003252001 [Kuraishia capsulata CBS 1993]CDK27274.1 unnamed protein product [Kuraishia capsulata CBS 1993]
MSVSLDDITPNNVGMLKKLVELSTLDFSSDWFTEAQSSEDLFKFGYFGEIPVGCVKAKPLMAANASDKSAPMGLVIEFLEVLPAYRGLSIEDKLLEHIETVLRERHLHTLWVLSPLEWASATLEKRGYFSAGDIAELQTGYEKRLPAWEKKL